MSELAQRLLEVIQRGPISFSDLWAAIPYEQGFDEMQAALVELVDAKPPLIERIDSAFAFRVAEAA